MAIKSPRTQWAAGKSKKEGLLVGVGRCNFYNFLWTEVADVISRYCSLANPLTGKHGYFN